nr:MAG TPA: hypothetical protein [Caudoviricetes sp.]
MYWNLEQPEKFPRFLLETGAYPEFCCLNLNPSYEDNNPTSPQNPQ